MKYYKTKPNDSVIEYINENIKLFNNYYSYVAFYFHENIEYVIYSKKWNRECTVCDYLADGISFYITPIHKIVNVYSPNLHTGFEYPALDDRNIVDTRCLELPNNICNVIYNKLRHKYTNKPMERSKGHLTDTFILEEDFDTILETRVDKPTEYYLVVYEYKECLDEIVLEEVSKIKHSKENQIIQKFINGRMCTIIIKDGIVYRVCDYFCIHSPSNPTTNTDGIVINKSNMKTYYIHDYTTFKQVGGA